MVSFEIAIFLDKYSGHLFHDVELYIICYDLIVKSLNSDLLSLKASNIYFINKPDMLHEKFNRNVNINSYLCKKLFNCKNFKIISFKDFNPIKYDIIVDRFQQPKKGINKAFANYILGFPNNYWYNSLKLSKPSIDTFKILYTSRQNTGRKLTDKSHNILCELIKKYNGTIINDLGEYSIEEQIKIFQSHNCVIGVHGNNLTGIMWMCPKSYIFEILPFKVKNSVYDYHCMSLCMNHQYTQINCQGNSHNGVFNFNEDDINYMKHTFHMLYSIYNN
tara:strand:- start:1427 stop:2254 length:828 start_codon:yes stop_codon:yes gene_type:complete